MYVLLNTNISKHRAETLSRNVAEYVNAHMPPRIPRMSVFINPQMQVSIQEQERNTMIELVLIATVRIPAMNIRRNIPVAITRTAAKAAMHVFMGFKSDDRAVQITATAIAFERYYEIAEAVIEAAKVIMKTETL